MPNDYDMLGLPQNASRQEIEDAYQKWRRYFTLVAPHVVKHEDIRKAYDVLVKGKGLAPPVRNGCKTLGVDVLATPREEYACWVEAYLKDPLGWPSPRWKGPI